MGGIDWDLDDQRMERRLRSHRVPRRRWMLIEDLLLAGLEEWRSCMSARAEKHSVGFNEKDLAELLG